MCSLLAEIEERYGTVHKFCRLHPDLNRSTVYQVLAGKYGGDVQKQIKRIQDAISDVSEEQKIMQTIKNTACARCSVTGQCDRCNTLFRAQARAVVQLFSS